MKTPAIYTMGVALALLIACAGFIASDAHTATVAFAQEGTAVPTTAPQATTQVQTAQPVERENDGFPWGLLGLAGLAGLAGLRRPEPVRHEPAQRTAQGNSAVGVYDTPKK